MTKKNQFGVLLLSALGLILILIFIGNVQPVAENPQAHKAVFYVS